jgi:hypothetical protein
MKKIFLIFIILSFSRVYSQDTTVITNIQMKVKTAKAVSNIILYEAAGNLNPQYFKTYLKLYDVLLNTKPDNEADLTIDTLSVSITDIIYTRMLFDWRYGLVFPDFKNSISAERAKNQNLDRLLNSHDSYYNTEQLKIIGEADKIATNDEETKKAKKP